MTPQPTASPLTENAGRSVSSAVRGASGNTFVVGSQVTVVPRGAARAAALRAGLRRGGRTKERSRAAVGADCPPVTIHGVGRSCPIVKPTSMRALNENDTVMKRTFTDALTLTPTFSRNTEVRYAASATLASAHASIVTLTWTILKSMRP